MFAVLPFCLRFVRRRSRRGFGADEAIGRVADKVFSVKLYERFADKWGVIGAVILKERSLELLFVIIGGNVYLFHGKRIYSRSEHYC